MSAPGASDRLSSKSNAPGVSAASSAGRKYTTAVHDTSACSVGAVD